MNRPASRFDRRPLLLVLFERSWRWFVYLALAWFLYSACGDPWLEGLSREAQRALAIFVVCIVLWVFHLLPLMVTSMLALVLPPLLGVIPAGESFAFFGNKAIFFLLGAFILAAAVSDCGLAERITLGALQLSSGSPRRLSISIYLTGAILSMVMSEHAVAALLFPIVLELCRTLDLDPRRSNLGRLLFLSMAWGCITGGVATLLGGARNPLAIGILEENTGQTIGFFEWTVGIWPAFLAVLVIAYTMLWIAFPIEKAAAAPAEEFLRQRSRKLGRISGREQIVGFLMAATIFAWVFFGEKVGLAEISLLAVILLFALRLITWRRVEEMVNWGVLLMYGGAIAIGSTLSGSGAMHWLAGRLLENSNLGELGILTILVTLSLFLTEGVSNSAVVSILMPFGIALSDSFSFSAKAATYAIALPSGLAFMLPMSTPAMALAYSSGYLRLKQVVGLAFLLNLIVIGISVLMIKWYWPLLGLIGTGVAP